MGFHWLIKRASGILFICCIYPLLGIGTPPIKQFDTKEAGISSENRAIIQDSTGRLLVGNSLGVNIYDGESWKTIPLPNRSKVRALALGDSNCVYVGGQDEFGKLTFREGEYTYQSLTKEAFPKGTLPGEIWNIHCANGVVIFQSEKSLTRYDNGKFTIIHAPNAFHFASFAIDDQLLVCDKILGPKTLHGTRLIQPPFETPDVSGLYMALPHLNDAMLLYSLENGVQISTPSHHGLRHVHNSLDLATFPVYAAIQLQNGLYAFASKSAGLLVTNEWLETIYHFTKQNGLSSNAINTVFEDSRGNLWLGQEKGLDFIELSSPFDRLSQNDGISGIAYGAAQIDDTLFIASSQGLYKRPIHSNTPFVDADPASIWNDVWFIKRLNHQLFLGNNFGTYEYDNGLLIPIQEGGNGGWDIQPLKGHSDLLLLGTYNGAYLCHKKNSRWKIKHKIEGFTGSFRIFEQDVAGSIWMSNPYQGIYHFRLTADLTRFEDVSLFDAGYGLQPPYPLAVYKNTCYTVDDRGLCTLHQNGVEPVGHIEFWPSGCEHINALQVIQDNLYLLNNKTITHFELHEDRFVYKQEINLPGRFAPNFEWIEQLDSNQLIAGVLNGALTCRQVNDAILFNALITHCTLTSIKKNQRVNLIGRHQAELPHSFNQLHVTFGTNFFQTEEMNYAYRLSGIQETWSPYSDQPFLTISNLTPGHYVLEIRSRNALGTVSAPAQMTFTIASPWYKTNWAFAVYILLLILITAALAYLLSLRTKRKYLKSLQQQRRKQLEERMHNQQETLDLKNKQLASQALQLHESQEMLAQVERRLERVYTEGESKTVTIKAVQDMIAGKLDAKSSWNEFEELFSHVHDRFFDTLRTRHPNLSINELRMCGFIKLNMTNKEIATIMNLSIRGFETARYRLKKKLALGPDQNLSEYVLNI